MQGKLTPGRQLPAAAYHFFILGIWTQPGSHPGEPASWRFSLQNSHSAERRGFSELAELVAFLQAWMQEQLDDERKE